MRMASHEAAPGHGVAVDHGEVVAARSLGAEVLHAGEPVAGVVLPDVSQPLAEGVAPALDRGRRLRPRPVVGDDDLEVRVALLREREQHGVERLRPLVRGHDHAARSSWEERRRVLRDELALPVLLVLPRRRRRSGAQPVDERVQP